MEPNPLISIVIPTHNRSQLLRRAVSSANEQSFEPIEVIVVDDASTDNTAEVLREIPGIRVIALSQNVGGAVARNIGAKEASGYYLAFLDSDDEWLPKKLAKQVDLLRRRTEVGAVYCRYFSADDRGRLTEEHPPLYRGNIRNTLLSGRCPKSVSLFLIRRSAFESVGGFDPQLTAFQDTDLWLRMSEHWHFDFIDEALAIIHDHSGPRITRSLEPRLNGLNSFLAKWGPEMEAVVGSAGVEEYRRKHAGVAWGSEVLRRIESGNRSDAWQAARQYARASGWANPRQAVGLLLALVFGSTAHEILKDLLRRHARGGRW